MTFSVKCRLASNAVERHIADTRPALLMVALVIEILLGFACVLVALAGLVFLPILTALYALYGVLVVFCWLVLAVLILFLMWQSHRGSLWAFLTTLVLFPLLGLVVRLILRSAFAVAPTISREPTLFWVVVALLGIVELILLLPPVVSWFFANARLRAKIRDLNKIANTEAGMAFADYEADRMISKIQGARVHPKDEVWFHE